MTEMTPCLRGHIAKRYGNRTCSECAKLRARTWKKDNPAKVSESGRRFYQENLEKERARSLAKGHRKTQARVDAETENVRQWGGQQIVLSRSDAITAGLTRYFWPGRPCRNGHIAERLVRDNRCVDCAEISRAKIDVEKARERERRHYRMDKEAHAESIAKSHNKRPWVRAIRAAARRALDRGMPFDLSFEWGKARWTGRCELTGIPFVISQGAKGGPRIYSPSLDRKDNSKGYTKENCRFILAGINALKNSGTDEDVFAIAIAIVSGGTRSLSHG